MRTRRRKLSGDFSSTTGRITRSKTSEDRRVNSLPIPIDHIIDIFSRLPVKSIAICRCVSKTWSSLLRRQDFTELFLSRSSTLPKLLLAYQKDGDLFFYSAPQPQNPDENSPPVVATYHLKLSFDGAFGVIGLDNGLVGVNGRRAYSVICNPSTGQSLSLTREKTRSTSLFGYDPVEKQVKVLSVWGEKFYGLLKLVAEEYQVMTLGTGNPPSWRVVDCGCMLSTTKRRFYRFSKITKARKSDIKRGFYVKRLAMGSLGDEVLATRRMAPKTLAFSNQA
ncbi:F-box protein DOR [Raphanus sativus]|nr:F-box protein DOR [Raphanus sativus]